MMGHHAIDRRTFLRGAGTVALATAVHSTPLTADLEPSTVQPKDGRYDFDTIFNRIGTNSSKWDQQIALYGREHIDVGMGTADQDFKAAPAITRALRARLEHENYGYEPIPDSYLKSIVDWHDRRHGLKIDPQTIRHSPGVNPALLSTLRALCPPQSKVLVLGPSYGAFYNHIRNIGAVLEESPLQFVDGRYEIDFDDFERRIDYDVRAFILCNPHNPIGKVWSPEDLMRLGEICTRRRVVVLSDEIHCDFVTTGNTYTPYAALDNEEIVRNSITYKSVSKAFNLSSMRCAYLFSTNQEYLDRTTKQLSQGINTLALVAAEAAYNESEEWLNQLVEYIDGTHDLVKSFVRTNMPYVEYVKVEGTYLVWLDVREALDKIGATRLVATTDASTPELAFQQHLIDHANIHINAGSNYGPSGSGRMRMNIATSRQLVELALNNMATALSR